MRPLTLDDLLPLEEYASRHREHFASLQRYLDRYRRIRLGPRCTLLFENRQTLWFRVHEILRVTRLSVPGQVQQELDLYNRLLPTRDHLHAALILERSEEAESQAPTIAWRHLRGEHLVFCLGQCRVAARLVTCRPEDYAVGTAHWLHFALGPAERQCLVDSRQPVWFEIHHPAYRHESAPLSEEMRQSLLEDLLLSDRDEERAGRKG